MKGIGTIVNVLALAAGGGIGILLHGKLPVRIQRLIPQFVGLAALFLGARSLLGSWFPDDTPGVEATGTMLVIFALLIGGLLGEALRIDRLLDKLGLLLSRLDRSRASTPSGKKCTSDPSKIESAPLSADGLEACTGNRFADGFVITTVLCAFSGMAFSGAINEGMGLGAKELFIKAAIDAVLVFALALSYDWGVLFGAASVLIVQGELTFIASMWSDKMTPTLVAHLVMISSVIAIGTGVALCFGKCRRVVNLVPALLISPLYGLIMQVMDKVLDK